MPQFEHGDVSIHYEVTGHGEGIPLLLLAPGAMNATIAAWQRAALNPLAAFEGEFRMISMDHRNAGNSTGPLVVEDPWGTYVQDQLDVLDHLAVERVQVIGCCIGVSYALKMCELAPHRVVSMVFEQPIGALQSNPDHWSRKGRVWGERLAASRPDVDPATAERFAGAMWDGGEFVVSVSPEFVRTCQVPMLVLPGDDVEHPGEISSRIVELAPNVELVNPWRDSPEVLAAATSRVRDFLIRHSS